MINLIKRRIRHLKPTRPKLFYEGATDGYALPKMSVSDSVQALEPRIMFDAAGVATGAEVAADDVAEQQAEQALTSENLQAQAVNQENENTDEVVEALAGLVPPAGRNEIIFVDKSVEDYTSLISSISSDAELIFIENNADGLEQIANTLQGRNDIDAIHIISHGDSGELQLGNTTLNQESIQGEHADELVAIRAALSEDADLLIYGCNFAEGEEGRSAAEALAEATGADVAASEDLTGAESLGGDWDLEYEFGNVGTVTLNAEAYENILFTAQDLDFVEYDLIDANGNDISGTDDFNYEEGDILRFHNVAGDGIDANTPGTGGIDAIVTITDVFYRDSTTGEDIGTDVPFLDDIDRTGSGALDPVLDAGSITGGAIVGSEIGATYTVRYVTADSAYSAADPSANSIAVDSFVSPIDIDSSGSLREAVAVTAPVVSVVQNNPTSLTTDLSYADGQTTISLEQGALNNGNPGVTTTPSFAAMFQVQNAEVFTVTIRSIVEAGSAQTGERLFSLQFNETAFTEANTLSVPIIDLDANDSTGATDLDYLSPSAYTSSVTSPGVPIADSDVQITDSDPTLPNMESATITLTNPQVGDQLLVGTLPAGITAIGAGTSTIQLSGIASIGDYEEAIKVITFYNGNSSIDGTDRTIEVTVNNRDVDSPTATATIVVFGTPEVNTQTTTNDQPTITGTWDIDTASSTGLQVTVNGTTYTLGGGGFNDALTTDSNGNWSLDLSVSGQTLPLNTYNVSVSTTNGTDTVLDETTNEITIIENPQWSFTGDIDVLEGNTASYTLSLAGAESLATGESIAVQFNIAGTATEGAANDYDLNQALIDAAASRPELSYVPGSFELIYTSPLTPAAFTDLTISVDVANADGVEGTENYDLTLTAGASGTNTSTVSSSANTINTTIYESFTAPTIAADPDSTTVGGTATYTEGDTSKDIFDNAVITNPEATQNIDQIVFEVTNAVDGANEILNIDGFAIQMTAGTGTTTSGYTYTVVDNGGDDYTVTIDIPGAGASTTDIEALVNNMSYTNSLIDTPTAGNRTVEIESIRDTGGTPNETTGIGITETINVVAVNDAPVVDGPTLPLTYSAGMDIHGTGFFVHDLDAGTATDLVLTLSSANGNITVAAGNSGLTNITNNGTGTVTLEGSVTQIDNFLRGQTTGTILYTTTGSPGDHQFTVTVNDAGNTGIDPGLSGDGSSEEDSASVTIMTSPNSAPVLDLDGNDSSGAGSGGYTANTFTEGGSPVNIADADTTLTDADSPDDDVTLLIVAENIQDGANEILNFGSEQIFLDGVNDAALDDVNVNGVLVDVIYDAVDFDNSNNQTLTITDQNGNPLSLADAITVLEAITYQNNDGTPTTGTNRTFSITANDGATSNTAVSTISVSASENPPVNTIGNQTATEDTLTSLTGISVNDTDGDLATVQLTVGNGDLTVSLAGGATISAGANGSSTLTLSGTETQINAALATLQYQGDTNFTGTDTLTMTSADADGGTADDTDIVNITVSPINDAPTLAATTANDTLTENTDVTSSFVFPTVTIDPIEAGDFISTATLTLAGGIENTDTLTIAGTAITGLSSNSSGPIGTHSYSYNAGTGELTITFAGSTTAAAAELILEQITYGIDAADNDPSTTARTVTLNTVTDNGSGLDTSTNVNETATINVTAVNDLTFTGIGSTIETFTEGGAATGSLFDVTALDAVETGDDITAIEIDLGNTEAGDTLLIGITTVDVGTDGVTGPDANGYTFTVSGGGTVLTITHAGQPAGTIETLLEGITFTGTDDTPTTAQRSFTIDTITDDSGTVDVTNVMAAVDVVPVNDPPTVDLDGDDSSGTGSGGFNNTFVIGAGAVNIADTDVVLGDAEDQLNDVFSLTIVANNLPDTTDEVLNFGASSISMDGVTNDTLDDVDVGGITVDVTYNAATNTFSITDNAGGTLTLAESTAVLEAITYQNNNGAPNTAATRTFSVTLNDGTDNSNTAVSSITVTADVDEEPIVTTLVGANPTHTEGAGATTALFSGSNIDTADPGDNQNIDSLVFTVTNVNDGANESLSIDGTTITLTNGASATGSNYDISVSLTGSVATVTLTASTLDTVTPATADDVVNNITYTNSGTPPSSADRVVTLTTIVDSGSNTAPNDNINDAVNISSTINMVSVTLDTDGDGVGDSVDLDDDNDGILDTDEGLSTGAVEVVNVSGLQTNSYTVTDDGQITITITGGDGGNEDAATGGEGATVTATFNVSAGEEIVYVVGQAGQSNVSDEAGGGGSTGVYIGNSTDGYRLVMVAGAGGGAEQNAAGEGGQSTTAGGNDGGDSFAGGTNGTGGTTGASAGGGGGVGNPPGNANGAGAAGSGGANTSGAGLTDTDPSDGLTIALGGTTNADGGDGFTAGGSGSGGEAGGGGGYSGGGAGGTDGNNSGGGGGGSFLDTGDSAYVSGSITAGANGGGTQSDGTLVVNFTASNTDTDGDGVANYLDLDSDNDGISDLQESGATSTITAYDTNNDGTISLTEGNAAGGTLNNGVWSFFGADASAGSSDGTSLVDTDSDSVDNYIDLDSDGDGIADAIEAQPTAGYTAFSATDTDSDGVVDNFDSGSGFGGNFNTPQDTDGDGTADYLDTDSDNDSLLDSAESGLTLSGTDANNDGIDDDASIGASYSDPDGVINNPSTDLANELGDTSEVGYRELASLPPELDLDDDDSSGATGNNFTKTVIPTPSGITATTIVDSDVTITDADDTNIESATITLTNAQAGDVIAVTGSLPAGITANVVGNTISLTGTATLAEYQTALQAITFANTNATVDGSDRTITFIVNDGDINSAVATTTLEVYGTPTVNTLTTANQQPTITGTFDEADSTATGLQVTVNGSTYILGTHAALTTDGSGNWSLNLATAGQTLPVNASGYDVSVTTTDGSNNVVDTTTSEVKVISTPEWNITGDTNVTEGNDASYTISLTGAELLSAGETVSIVLTPADISATVGSDTAAFDAAVTAAIGARTDLAYDAGTNTLTYTASSNPYTATYDNTTDNFNDISGTGSVVTLGDDASSSQAIGFNFDFYGTTYSNVFVGSNGTLTFGGGVAEFGNDDFSAGGLMNSASGGTGVALPGIAALWDDFNPADSDSDDVYIQQTTEGGVNVLIVQYNDIVPFSGGAGNRGTFQVVLFEGSNDIEVRYQDVNFASGNTNGASATIGVSDGTTSNFTQYSYNTASIADNSNIRFTQPTASMSDLVIDLAAVVDAADGPEDYNISIGTPGGTGTSAIGTDNSVTTTIYDVDTPPTITATPDAGITFTENVDTNVDLFDSVTVETNENDRTVEEITFSVSGLIDGSNEILNVDGTAIQLTNGSSGVTASYTYSVSVTAGTATVTLTTTGATEAAIQTVVDNMSYQNNATEDPTAGNRVVTIESITDSGTSGLNETTGIGISATVDVIAVNDAPVVGAPGSQLAYPGSTINIHGTGFTVSEVDDRGATVSVTLSVDEGTINVAAGDSGVGSISGSGTSTVTLTGTIAQVDNFLTGAGTGTITYTAAGSPTSDATFTVTVNDQGNTGNDPGLTGDGSSEEGTNSVTIDTFQNVTFALSRDTASIDEEGVTDNDVQFTVTLSEAVKTGNTVSVDLDYDAGSVANNADLTASLVATLTAQAAATTGVTFDGTDTLTFDDTFVGTTFNFTLTANNDNDIEGTEALTLELSNATNASGTTGITTATASTNITEADQAVNVTLVQSTSTVNEESGTTSVTYDVDLSAVPNSSNTVSVVIAQTGGSATDGTDFTQDLDTALTNAATATNGVSYNSGTNTLTFDSNYVLGSFDFTLTATNDSIVDNGETFEVTANGATISNGSVTVDGGTSDSETVTINDIDQDVDISIDTPTTSISEEGEESATFTISLSQALTAGNSVTVDIGHVTGGAEDADIDPNLVAAINAGITAAGGAASGITFDGTTLTFIQASGFTGTTFSFDVTADNDQLVEGTEALAIELTNYTNNNGTGSITTASDSVNITETDVDIEFNLAVDATNVNEGVGDITYTITLNRAVGAGNEAVIQIDPTGTAGDGSDYEAWDTAMGQFATDNAGVTWDTVNNRFTIDGDVFTGTSLQIDVDITDDMLPENTETLTATISNASIDNGTASVGTNSAVTTNITDNDNLEFNLAVDATNVNEGVGDITYTITLNRAVGAGNEAVIQIDPTGTAGDGSDYEAWDTAMGQFATDNAGVTWDTVNNRFTIDGDVFTGTSLQIDVDITDDMLPENTETLTATISNASIDNGTASVGTNSAVTTNITDNDNLEFNLAVDATNVNEGVGDITYTITLNRAVGAGNEAVIQIDPTGTAGDGSDYEAWDTAMGQFATDNAGVTWDTVNNRFTIDGDVFTGTSLQIDVDITDDMLPENTETLTATISNASIDNGTASVGTNSAVTTNITDNDNLEFNLAVDATNVNEGVGDITYTITLNRAVGAGNEAVIQIDPTGTAGDGSDYEAWDTAMGQFATDNAGVTWDTVNNRFTIDGDVFTGTSLQIDVDITDDMLPENTETLTATISNASIDNGTASVGTNSAVTTNITDNDNLEFNLAVDATNVNEGVGDITYTITLNRAVGAGNEAVIQIDPTGTAGDGSDYEAWDTAMGQFATDNAGVTWDTVNNRFTIDGDVFTGTSLQIDVDITDDMLPENTETLTATISNASIDNGTASVGTNSAVTTNITDNDNLEFNLAVDATNVNEGVGDITYTITLNRAVGAGNEAVIQIDPTGTAGDGSDYEAWDTAMGQFATDNAGVTWDTVNNRFTIDGDVFTGTSLQIDVDITDDMLPENTETLTATISNASIDNGTASVGTNSAVTTNITDNDNLEFNLAVDATNVNEGVGDITYTITLNRAVGAGNEAVIQIDPTGTAGDGSDYEAWDTAMGQFATDNAGVTWDTVNNRFTIDGDVFTGTSLQIDVDITDDMLPENTETLTATISNASIDNGTASVGTNSAVTTNITDNDNLEFNLAVDATNVNEGVGDITYTITLNRAVGAGNEAVIQIDPTGTAGDGSDYEAWDTAMGQFATDNAGVTWDTVNNRFTIDGDVFTGTSLQIDVDITDDMLPENTETLTATISNASIDNGTASVGTNSAVTTNITDNDNLEFNLAVDATNVNEGVGDITYTITLNRAVGAGNEAVIQIDPTGTAGDGSDYEAWDTAMGQFATDNAGVTWDTVNNRFTIDGDVFTGTSLQIDVDITDDMLPENTETLTATISNASIDNGTASVGTNSAVTTNITDNDNLEFNLAVDATNVNEGVGDITYTITLNRAVGAGNEAVIQIDPTGTAGDGSDYEAWDTAMGQFATDNAGVTWDTVNNRFTIDGDVFTGTSLQIDVDITDDMLPENTETLTATISNASIDNGTASVGTNSAVTTNITDNDNLEFNLAVDATNVNEGVGDITYTITLNRAVGAGNEAVIQIDPTGTAGDGSDYEAWDTAMGQFATDNAGVTWDTVNNRFTIDGDVFTGTSLQIDVDITDDMLPENTETLTATISNASIDNGTASVGTNSAVTTNITDNDNLEFNLAVDATNVNEGVGDITYTITLNRAVGAGNEAVIQIDPTGTAGDGSDYEAWDTAMGQFATDNAGVTWDTVNNRFTIDGDVFTGTSLQIDVDITDDMLPENTETLTATISNASIDNGTASVGTNSAVTTNITDNDNLEFNLAVDATNVNEGVGDITYTITLNRAVGAGNEAVIQIDPTGTAGDGSDYEAWDTAMGQFATDNAGVTWDTVNNRFTIDGDVFTGTSLQIDVDITDDMLPENTETLTATISNASIDNGTASVGTNSAVTTNITDNDNLEFNLAVDATNVNEGVGDITYTITLNRAVGAGNEAVIQIDPTGTAGDGSDYEAWDTAMGQFATDNAGVTWDTVNNRFTIDGDVFTGTSLQIDVDITDDMLPENTETLTATISNASIDNGTASVGTNSAVTTNITDNDNLEFNLAVDATNVNEGVGDITYTITLNRAVGAGNEAVIQIDPTGTAGDGSDYEAWDTAMGQFATDNAGVTWDTVNNRFTIDGDVFTGTSLQIDVDITDDMLPENTETLTATISNASIDNGTASVGTNSAVTTNITDNDNLEFNLAVDATNVNEGVGDITYTITLNRAVGAGNEAVIQIDPTGTAGDGSDYEAWDTAMGQFATDNAGVTWDTVNNRFTIDGDVFTGTSLQIDVDITDDMLPENTETLTATISNASIDNGTASVGTNSAVTTNITDNDNLEFNLAVDATNVNEGVGDITYTITLNRAVGAGNEAVIQIDPTGTAGDGSDYEAWDTAMGQFATDNAGVTWDTVNNRFTIDGDVFTGTSLQIDVDITDDMLPENTETLTATISNASIDNGTASVGTNSAVTTNITDNDNLEFNLAVDATNVNEGVGDITYTITLNRAVGAGNEAVIQIDPTGTAGDGSDYEAWDTAMGQFATDNAGVTWDTVNNRFTIDGDVFTGTSLQIDVDITDDMLPENTETLTATISNASIDNGTASVGTNSAVTTNITDNDNLEFNLAVDATNVNEGVGDITYTITLNRAVGAGNEAVIQIDPTGTAGDGSDYEAWDTAMGQFATDNAGVTWDTVNNRFTIDGDVFTGTSLQIDVDITDDMLPENTETLTATISNASIDNGTASVGTNSAVTTNITDNDNLEFNLAVDATNVNEGVGDITYTITLNRAVGAGNEAVIQIDPTGTAGDGSDYEAWDTAMGQFATDNAGVTWDTVNNRFTIDGDVFTGTSLQIDVDITDDMLPENTETLTATISNASIDNGTASVGTNSAVTTNITDNDNLEFNLAVDATNVNEGVGDITYTITLNRAVGAGNEAVIQIDPTGTAGDGSDYEAWDTAMGQFATDNAGVTWDTVNNRFTIDGDVFTGTSLQIDVDITDDMLPENTETLTATISNASIDNGTASVGTNSAVTTNITDNDNLEFNLAVDATNVNEGVGDITYTITLNRAVGAGNEAVIQIDPTGTAGDGSDYEAWDTAMGQFATDNAGVTWDTVNNRFTIDGDVFTGTSLQIDVDITDDMLPENTETLTATISNASIDNGTASVGTNSAVTTNITDNDNLEFNLAVDATNVNEGVGDVTYTISLNRAVGAGNTATIEIDPTGTATDGSDYEAWDTAMGDFATATNGVTWDSANNRFTIDGDVFTGTSLQIDVDITDDALPEDTETLTATITNATIDNGTASIGTNSAVTTNITDNDNLEFNLAVDATSVNEGVGDVTYTISLNRAVGAGNTATIEIDPTGTATDGSDYEAWDTAMGDFATATNGVTWDSANNRFTIDGDDFTGTSLQIDVDITDDALPEDTETLTATITNATIDNGTASVGTNSAVTTNITDNDALKLDLSVDTATVSEAGGELIYRINLNKSVGTGNTVSFDISHSGTTSAADIESFANALSDMAAANNGVSFDGVDTVTINGSVYTGTQLSFSVSAVDDALVESNETVVATLSNATISSGIVNIGTASITGTILDNDSTTTDPGSGINEDQQTAGDGDNNIIEPRTSQSQNQNNDRELAADGAVIDAVGDAKQLGSTRALGADGAVLEAVAGADSSKIYFGDTVSSELADSVGLWDVSGVKGFSVSFSVSETTTGAEADLGLFPLRIGNSEVEDRDQLLVKSILRDRTLFLEIDYKINSDPNLNASNVSVMQVDGSPLPSWLRIDDEGGLVSGEPPVGTEKVELRIEVTLSDDSVIVRYIDVNVNSGEIAALQKIGTEVIAGASLFDQQVEQEADKFNDSSDSIKNSFIN